MGIFCTSNMYTGWTALEIPNSDQGLWTQQLRSSCSGMYLSVLTSSIYQTDLAYQRKATRLQHWSPNHRGTERTKKHGMAGMIKAMMSRGTSRRVQAKAICLHNFFLKLVELTRIPLSISFFPSIPKQEKYLAERWWGGNIHNTWSEHS